MTTQPGQARVGPTLTRLLCCPPSLSVQVKPSWQNHLLDTDMASRPFQPVRVVLEPPQATGEGLVNSLHTVKSAVGEYHKLPLQVPLSCVTCHVGWSTRAAWPPPLKPNEVCRGSWKS